MNKGTFRCVFGDHEYSEKLTFDRRRGRYGNTCGRYVNMCIHCNLHGKYKNSLEDEVYVEYYTNGYRKREMWLNGNKIMYHQNGNYKTKSYRNGFEEHYNKSGVHIYTKYEDGTEEWLHKGEWVKEKPKNWDPEKTVYSWWC